MPAIRHHKITVDGLGVVVREADDPAQPTIVLLPGYPSSTRAYVRLIDRLASNWHTAAIDYPGFGSSRSSTTGECAPSSPRTEELMHSAAIAVAGRVPVSRRCAVGS